MSYKEFVKMIAEVCETTQVTAELFVDSVFDELQELMLKKDELTVKNFGTFYLSELKSGMKFNPYTKEKFYGKGGYTPRIKFSKNMKKRAKEIIDLKTQEDEE